MSQRRHQKVNFKNNLRQIKVERKHTKTLGDEVKAVLRGRFIVINACIQENQINNLTLPLKESEKEELPKLTVIRGKKITKLE